MPLPDHLAELDRRYRARLEAAAEQLRRSFEQRLRAASEGLSAALAEVRAETPEALFDAEDFTPLESAARQGGERAALDTLLAAARAFDGADSQGAVLDALLAGAGRFAPRVALLIADRDGVRGWGGAGFGAEGEGLVGRESTWLGDALDRFAAGEGVVHAHGPAAGDLAGRLGLPDAEQAVLVPLVLRDQIAGALYADWRAEEPALPVAALQLLVLGAAQRLELQTLSARAFTPTLHAAGALAFAGLPLWDPTALVEPEPAAAPAVEPAEEWSDEAAGAVFELEPEAVEPAAARLAPSAPEPAVEPEPAVAPEPAVELLPRGLEPSAKSGIEELFEAPEAEELAPVAELEPPPAAEPEAPAPTWSGPEMVSWAQPETPPAPPPPSGSWSARDAVTWAPPARPPAPELAPPAAAEWEMEQAEGEATVFIGDAAPLEPPAIAPPPPPEKATAPFELPAIDTRSLPLGLDGASTGEVAVPETTAPIPTLAQLAGAATLAVPTLAMPIAPDLTEDATLLVTRPPLPAPPPEPSEDATLLVARPPLPAPPPAEAVEATEDQTHPGVAAPRPAAEEDVNDRTATRAARGTEVAPPPDLQGPGLAFTMSRTQRASGENALHEEARRLARLLVSEIKLYNEEQVEEGRRHRDLYLRLREDIDRSRQIYEERVHDSVRGTTDYFQQELVRSLAGGDPRALGM